MHNKDISIVSQVAFKEAVGLLSPDALFSDEGRVTFLELQSFLSDALFADVIAKTAEHADPEPERTVVNVPASSGSAQSQIEQAFPGSVLANGSTGYSLEVIDKQGDIPAWLIEACQKDGVTAVFDNRSSRVASKNQPYFRQKGGAKKGYWPPKVGK